MEWLHTLFFGNGIAHAVLTFALVITVGILLGKVKIGGVSLGITWILFVGIVLSHFGMTVDGEVRHFVQEFGLILFVFSIGLQVGPGFFASFKHGGMTLVMCAVAIVLLGVATAYVVHLVTGTPIPTMVGILSGAVTNTPGLGAAQQAYADASGIEDPTIALGYAVAYPLGVVGIIFTMIFIRYALRVKFEKEDEGLAALSPGAQARRQGVGRIHQQDARRPHGGLCPRPDQPSVRHIAHPASRRNDLDGRCG